MIHIVEKFLDIFVRMLQSRWMSSSHLDEITVLRVLLMDNHPYNEPECCMGSLSNEIIVSINISAWGRCSSTVDWDDCGFDRFEHQRAILNDPC